MNREGNQLYTEGQVLLIDKPLHWTSFDVVRKIRGLTGVRKVGHAGTLDPLATGLLIVCTGKFTKRIQEFMAQDKEYTGCLVLGAITPSFDLETAPDQFKDTSHLSSKDILEAASRFSGELMQIPPAYSAIKKDGKRSYEWARKGKELTLEPRKIHIWELEVTSIELPFVKFRTVCSTGTYIRSLVRDLGEAIGVGAYLNSLCRTRIGPYRLDQSMTMAVAEQSIRAAIGR